MFASFPRISACFTQWAILSCASFSAATLKVLILWCPEAGLETAAGLFVNEMCSTVPQCLIAGEFLAHGSLTQLLIPWWKPGWFSCFHKPTLEEQKDETLHFFLTRQASFPCRLSANNQRLQLARQNFNSILFNHLGKLVATPRKVNKILAKLKHPVLEKPVYKVGY